MKNTLWKLQGVLVQLMIMLLTLVSFYIVTNYLVVPILFCFCKATDGQFLEF